MENAGKQILFAGGRVIDPETGLDAVRDVMVRAGRIEAVAAPGELPAAGAKVRDARGLVVAPGFIDLHSHTNSLAGQWLQLYDGVTTALELEIGAVPVSAAAARARREGRAAHFGFSASWAVARMQVLGGILPRGGFGDFQDHVADAPWQRPATRREIASIIAVLDEQLHDGGIGIGVAAGYAPYFGPEEYEAVATLAQQRGVPVFTHARDLREVRPDTPIDGAEEIVLAARRTGARMHFCHLHSSSARHIPRVLDLVGQAQADGVPVSVEAYPYGAGMTTIGAAFLDADGLARRGLQVTDLVHAASGERLLNLDRLEQLRRADPGALVLMDNLYEDRPADFAMMLSVLRHPGAIIASDAMPLTDTQANTPTSAQAPTRTSTRSPALDSLPAWPIPEDVRTHPRTAGTFTKAIRLLHRGAGEALISVIGRATVAPARLLEGAVPQMKRKGRVEAGCDADLIAFDPATVTDTATYRRSTSPASGMQFVVVGGEIVIDGGTLDTGARGGRQVAGSV